MLNVVVRFKGKLKKVDPLKLTKIIRGQVGEVKYVRVLGDGNLLIGCNTEADGGGKENYLCWKSQSCQSGISGGEEG